MSKQLSAGDESVQARRELRETLGSFLTGVTVITTLDAEGRPRGMTASSFTSVSLDPPLVLFCVDRSAASYGAFLASEGYAVHILGIEQQELARTFASRSAVKFEGVSWTGGASGAPLLGGSHAWLDCITESTVIAGDHAVIIGRVVDFGADEQRPLGYYRGGFHTFSPQHEFQAGVTAGADEHVWIGWLLETGDGRVPLVRSADGSLRLPAADSAAGALGDERLARLTEDTVGQGASVEFLYSMYHDADREVPGMLFVFRGRLDSVWRPPIDDTLYLWDAANPTWEGIADGPERAMLQRYVSERLDASFGIYSGSSSAGYVAAIASITRDAATEEFLVSEPAS